MLHSLYQTTVVISLCLLILACGQSDSEERIEGQMLLRFEHYYQTAAASEQEIPQDELGALATLSQQNSDALRTLAFLWQQRANLICDNASSSQTALTETYVGYESLLNDSQQSLPSISEETPETVACTQAFYDKNFQAIHNMLLFHTKTSGL
ncbi:hypothetical protein N9F47_01770 [Gammaproteobacteria bacterium]|nr:hypothetical protein [Gammaproteobacteria bacterium]